MTPINQGANVYIEPKNEGCSFADKRLAEIPRTGTAFNWDGQLGWLTLHRRPVIAEKKNTLNPVEPGKGTGFIGERCCRAATWAKNTHSPTSVVSGNTCIWILKVGVEGGGKVSE